MSPFQLFAHGGVAVASYSGGEAKRHPL